MTNQLDDFFRWYILIPTPLGNAINPTNRKYGMIPAINPSFSRGMPTIPNIQKNMMNTNNAIPPRIINPFETPIIRSHSYLCINTIHEPTLDTKKKLEDES